MNFIKKKCSFSGPTKLPEDRVRYWNAYLLFYERIRTSRMSGRRTSSRLKVLRRSHESPGAGTSRQDSLSELSELVHQGEKQVCWIHWFIFQSSFEFHTNSWLYEIEHSSMNK